MSAGVRSKITSSFVQTLCRLTAGCSELASRDPRAGAFAGVDGGGFCGVWDLEFCCSACCATEATQPDTQRRNAAIEANANVSNFGKVFQRFMANLHPIAEFHGRTELCKSGGLPPPESRNSCKNILCRQKTWSNR